MYNLWWLTIAFGILLLIGIFLWILGFCLANNYDYEFENMGWGGVFLSAITGIAFAILLCFSIAQPIAARNEYNTFIETQVMVEEVYNAGGFDEFENVGLNNKIIELNNWLAHARAHKKQLGNWSMYCALDLDSLHYIKLVKGDLEDELVGDTNSHNCNSNSNAVDSGRLAFGNNNNN